MKSHLRSLDDLSLFDAVVYLKCGCRYAQMASVRSPNRRNRWWISPRAVLVESCVCATSPLVLEDEEAARTTSCHERFNFTLIELMIVVAIIGILARLLYLSTTIMLRELRFQRA